MHHRHLLGRGVLKPGKRKRTVERPPDTRKHTVLPVSIRLKSTEKTPTCVSMRAFLQPISARIYFGKTASHRKRARFVQSRGAPPQAYWMSVKAAQRWGCAKLAFCGVCFLMPGGLKGLFFFCYAFSHSAVRVTGTVVRQSVSPSAVLAKKAEAGRRSTLSPAAFSQPAKR